ncbi:MAG TPA: sensor histidine kinase [Pseudonocardiaceae bacterium]
MGRLWAFVRRYGFDALIVAAAIQSAVVVGLVDDPDRAPRTTAWFAVPAIAAVVLALLARHRFHFGAPATVWLAAAAISFVDGRLVVLPVGASVAGMASSFLLGNLRSGAKARFGLAVVLGGSAIIVYNDPNQVVGDYSLPFLFAIAWVAGFALRERVTAADAAEQRAATLEQEQEEAERRAIVEERARIAREMHDVVSHHVTVMTVQAAAVRRLLRSDQERERQALVTVEQTGREALREMRRLVGVLRDTAEPPALAPQPSLSQISKLVAQAREAGLPVELRIDGEPVELPASIDLTAYRLVQEGLTNAISHARAEHAQVQVRYAAAGIEVEVCDDGRGTDHEANRNGHGLVGMRERVSIYGGRLEAGPRAEGGYRLRAWLPVQR